MLGHDTHGHAEQSSTGCIGFLQTDRRRRRRTAATCSASSARATPTRAARAGGAAAHDDQPGPDPPEAPGGRARRHPVRHEHGDHDRRRRRRHAPQQPRGGRLDAAERSVQPAPDRHDHVPRGRRGRGPHRRARRWRRSRSAQDSITGPIVATANLVSTGGTAVWTSQTFPIVGVALPARTSCSSCSARSRAAPPAATCST